jgi:cysteine-rich repeat protein
LVRAWGLLAFVLGACIEPALVVCEDGRACAPNLLCDDTHATCVSAEQVAACAGQADLTPCQAGKITGQCFAEVCLAPGCGNRAVEPQEQCDDGNAIDGDGCSADCTSNERCTNGVIDTGEACDDGNLVSHDGCSSRCLVETVTWSAEPAWFSVQTEGHAAFDAQRRRLVIPDLGATWEWDGQRWSTFPVGPTFPVRAVVYDSTRGLIIAIGSRSALTGFMLVPFPLEAAEWNGATWTTIVTAFAPIGEFYNVWAIYDSSRQRIVASFDSAFGVQSGVMALDLAKKEWQQLAAPSSSTVAAAYDPVRDRILALSNGAPPTLVQFDGTTWSSASNTTMPPYVEAITYDAGRAGIVLVGSRQTAGPAELALWNGSGFVDTSARVPVGTEIAWHDPVDDTIGTLGGTTDTRPRVVIRRITGTTVTSTMPLLATSFGPLAFHSRLDEILLFESLRGVFAYRESWRQASSSWPRDFGMLACVYDPIRGGVVGHNANMAYLFDEDWTALSVTGFFAGTSMIYDHSRRRIIAQSNGQLTHSLGSTATSWEQISSTNIGFATFSLERNVDRLVAYSDSEGYEGLYDLEGDTWKRQFTLGPGYVAVSEPETGGTLLVPSDYSTGAVWQRNDTGLDNLGARLMPLVRLQTQPVNASRGRIAMLVGGDFWGALVIRQLTSETPDESCTAGEDIDGDGAAGCDDPDCWQVCFPGCPFATSACL